MLDKEQALGELNEMIQAVEALDPSRGADRSAWHILAKLPGRIRTIFNALLPKNYALFLDIDPKNPSPDPRRLAEIEDIVALFSTPLSAEPERSIVPFDHEPPTEEELLLFKKSMLILLYCVRFAVLFGLLGGAWVNIKALGGPVNTVKGQIAAVGSGALAGIAQPQLDGFLADIQDRITGSPTFKGEASGIIEHFKLLITSLTGATTILGVLKWAEKIEAGAPGTAKYFLFGGYFLAFLVVGAEAVAGELIVGKKLAIEKPTATTLEPSEAGALSELVNKAVDRLRNEKIWLKMALPWALQWAGYWEYYEPMLLVAHSDGARDAATWSSLAIFLIVFNIGNHWIAKTNTKPAASATSAV